MYLLEKNVVLRSPLLLKNGIFKEDFDVCAYFEENLLKKNGKWNLFLEEFYGDTCGYDMFIKNAAKPV